MTPSGSTALLTDLYELTMGAGYFKHGMHDRRAAFHLFFRQLPFGGGYAIAAGLEEVLQWLEKLHFDESDIAYLRTLKTPTGETLFEERYLSFLHTMRFSCDIDAMPEGTAVFGHEPLLRVEGPLLQAQLVETALLNILNFQTLLATKASRVCDATQGETVLEMGLRRAQGMDGALSAARAAYIGGVDATSNVLAGKMYGIPVRGTHAHSWVMAFASEVEAFQAYAEAQPHNCVFLVDTYDTLKGVAHAIEVGVQLKQKGHALAGIRLDSGDLAYLSIEARKMLDAAGFTETTIVASNDLDEHLIENLKHQGARISVWGVGTKLITAFDQPALGGVYKLAALQDAHGVWQHKVKISEQAIKTSNPGILNVRRYKDGARFVADAIFERDHAPAAGTTIIDPMDALRRRTLPDSLSFADLLLPTMRNGKRVDPAESLAVIRARAKTERNSLHATVRRFLNPHTYPVGLDQHVYEEKARLVLAARENR